jgi:hypothetical protein
MPSRKDLEESPSRLEVSQFNAFESEKARMMAEAKRKLDQRIREEERRREEDIQR